MTHNFIGKTQSKFSVISNNLVLSQQQKQLITSDYRKITQQNRDMSTHFHKVMWIFCFAILLTSLSTTSCKDRKKSEYQYEENGHKIDIRLESDADTLHFLCLYLDDRLHSQWELNYPIYAVDFGDVDNDGVPDILVGVIKTTRFDPNLDKRLFIFKVTKEYYIRPKWLGSRVGKPLVDFRLKKEKEQAIIKTIEKEEDGTFLVANYKWRGFGLQFIDYNARNLTEHSARKEFGE